jgi:hypothetical protein
MRGKEKGQGSQVGREGKRSSNQNKRRSRDSSSKLIISRILDKRIGTEYGVCTGGDAHPKMEPKGFEKDDVVKGTGDLVRWRESR